MAIAVPLAVLAAVILGAWMMIVQAMRAGYLEGYTDAKKGRLSKW